MNEFRPRPPPRFCCHAEEAEKAIPHEYEQPTFPALFLMYNIHMRTVPSDES